MIAKLEPRSTALPVICPDYDEDCLDMSHQEAIQCYDGFPGNNHLMELGVCGKEGIGLACGRCPIIAQHN